jgi:hypothetical protein
MWQTHTPYDPEYHARNQQKHGSWVLQLNPAFRPHDPPKIQVTKRAGRGPVSIETFPSSDNNQTLSIKIDDDDFGGADWYDVQVSW